jgi:hypothetical protein
MTHLDQDYYKLYNSAINANIRLKLGFIKLSLLTQDQKEKLAKKLNMKNASDLSKVSYIISDGNLNFRPYLKQQNNFETSSRFLKGIKRAISLDELNLFLSKAPSESIHIVSTGSKNLANQIVNKFYENSVLFNENTLNFINYKLGLFESFYEERFQSIIKKNEILIFFNPMFYTINLKDTKSNKCNENIFIYNKKMFQLKKFDFSNINFDSNDMLVYKFNYNKQEDFKKQIEDFSKVIQSLIEKEGSTINFKRLYFTNNTNLARYYKLKFVHENKKLVFVYLDKNKLSKININPDSILNMFIKNFEKIGEENFKYLVTYNPQISNIFNIQNKPNENITIRFIDYKKIVNYDENVSGSYKITDLNQISLESEYYRNKSKNLLFYYKCLYNKFTINENEFFEEVESFINSDKNNFISRNPQHLESVVFETDLPFDLVTGQTFLDFKKIPGKKTLFAISDNCIGCGSISKILEEMIKNEKNLPKVFIYDIMNESIHFKKIKKAPMIYVFENEKVLNEYDINQLTTDSELSYDTSVSQIIQKNILNKNI